MEMGFWDRRARKYDDAIGKHDAAYAKTLERTKSLLSLSDAVLDLGCASGEFALDIAPFVRRIDGIDTSTGMVALAQEKATHRSASNVTFASTDAFDRSLDARGYTRILAFSVLHLVPDLPAVLGRLHQLLPAGGLLISETPCFDERGRLLRWFVGISQKLKLLPPILSLTGPGLEAAVAAAAFEVVESREWDAKNAVRWIVARKR